MLLPMAAAQAATGSPPFTECPAVNYAPSCNIELQVNVDNSVSVTADTSTTPYDGSDDTLVGIVNSSAAPVSAVTVTGPGSDLAGFDGDGLCAYTGCNYGPTGYEGPGTSLVTDPNLPDSAEVDFTPALAPGATAYFSLEGALQYAQLTVRQGSLHGAGGTHELIYVHGINEPASGSPSDFSSIFTRVRNVSYDGFVYYEDQAQADGSDGGCGSGLPADVVAKAAAVRMPISTADATGTPVCDGASDIGINAIKLDEQIKADYAASGNTPVILAGYSLGGTIIRGMLAYSRLSHDGVADTMIDSVSFLHGVQQGSYLADAGQAIACEICLPGLPAVYNPLTAKLSSLLGLPVNRPATQELQTQSAWFSWVNNNSTNLPAIPFFNNYADIRVVAQVCVIPGVFACQDVGQNTWGDDVVLRGTDSPTDLPPGGGHKFLNGQAGPQNWEFRELHRYYWDPTFPPSEFLAYGKAFLSAPEQHVNVIGAMNQIQVPDCRGNQPINNDDEMVRLLNGRASGTPYNCTP